MKRLLCFLDGTWDEPTDKSTLTNVVKLYDAALPAGPDGTPQTAHYEIGIATDSKGLQSFLEGAAGLDVDDRIRSAYSFLASNYAPGDEIAAFGFSRGAFQARSLFGLIDLLGLPREASEARIAALWSLYEQHRAPESGEAIARARAENHYPVRLGCLGVWDTVGNIGVPLLGRESRINRLFAFHETALPPTVAVALHALAIDEPRGPFSPTLFTRNAGERAPEGQVVEQVWFPGSHANVGGGLENAALSDIALLWMAERARTLAGVGFDHARLAATTRPDPLGEQYVPGDGVFRLSLRVPFVRLVQQERGGAGGLRGALLGSWRTSVLPSGVASINESIHDSALMRLGKPVPVRRGETVTTVDYRPSTLRAALKRSAS